MSTECYVCYEPCIDKAPCLCKTLYVHPSCITILRMYGNKECGVCKTPFDDTDIVDLVLDAPPPSPPRAPPTRPASPAGSRTRNVGGWS